ncbi:MAG: hypothetical protein QME52_02245 [Bacteroidota bacterium]|nr:hypothetical protein [Bacteroidota bacterium]
MKNKYSTARFLLENYHTYYELRDAEKKLQDKLKELLKDLEKELPLKNWWKSDLNLKVGERYIRIWKADWTYKKGNNRNPWRSAMILLDYFTIEDIFDDTSEPGPVFYVWTKYLQGGKLSDRDLNNKIIKLSKFRFGPNRIRYDWTECAITYKYLPTGGWVSGLIDFTKLKKTLITEIEYLVKTFGPVLDKVSRECKK